MEKESIENQFLHDKNFVKLDGKLLIMWSIIASILFLFVKDFFDKSIYHAIIFLILGLFLGFIIKVFILIKYNKTNNFNIPSMLINLIFILNLITIIFASIISVILYKIQAIALIYPLFLFSIFIPRFVIGSIVNCSSCKATSSIVMLVSFLILMFISIFPEYINNDFLISIIQYISAFFVFFIYFILGIYKVNK